MVYIVTLEPLCVFKLCICAFWCLCVQQSLYALIWKFSVKRRFFYLVIENERDFGSTTDFLKAIARNFKEKKRKE